MNCIQHIKLHSQQAFERGPLLSLWQAIAEMFYPARADFTVTRTTGAEFADNLMSSYTITMGRDLSNAFGAMLRPASKEWFSTRTNRREKEDTEAKRWLENLSGTVRRAMYDRDSQFTRATKEGDFDFANFGQCVISVEEATDGLSLLYRCWHLRDVAWSESAGGKISRVYRKWQAPAYQICEYFQGKGVHPDITKCLEREPFKTFELIHCVMTSRDYECLPGGKRFIQPYVSCWIDVEHESELECVGSWTQKYVIPRWATVSGSQYAHSPATMAALPDGRLLQALTRVMLQAGEKAVDPPMVGVLEAIRGDVAIYPGGTTWVDADYDERKGGALRPLYQDKGQANVGFELLKDIRMQLAETFYATKLNLPPTTGGEMTAFEVSQRIQEFIRNAMPLFEPMESDYNGQICEQSLELMARNSPQMFAQAPKSLRGAKIEFVFESPLHEATERVKIGQFMEAQQILAAAVQLDPGLRHIINGKRTVRDVLEAATPANWLNSEMEMEALARSEQQAAQVAQVLSSMQQGADVAKTIGETTAMQKAMP